MAPPPYPTNRANKHRAAVAHCPTTRPTAAVTTHTKVWGAAGQLPGMHLAAHHMPPPHRAHCGAL